MFFPIWGLYRLLAVKDRLRDILLPALGLLLGYAIFLTFRYGTYGYLLPNTAYLKLATSLETVGQTALWLLDFLRLRPAFALLLGVGGYFASQGVSLEPPLILLSFEHQPGICRFYFVRWLELDAAPSISGVANALVCHTYCPGAKNDQS